MSHENTDIFMFVSYVVYSSFFDPVIEEGEGEGASVVQNFIHILIYLRLD